MATARNVMKTDVVVVPNHMGIRELAALLSEKMISGAPVVNDRGDLIGVVSTMDIVDHIGHEKANHDSSFRRGAAHFHGNTDEVVDYDELQNLQIEDFADLVQVSQIMTSKVFQVDESTIISTVAKIMCEEGVHRVVVTRNQKVVGIITSLDVLEQIAGDSCGGK